LTEIGMEVERGLAATIGKGCYPRAIANFVIAARFPLLPGEKRLNARLVLPERRQILV